jgi:hypothetical protein
LRELQISVDFTEFLFTIIPMARTGRPKKAAKERRSEVIALRLTRAEYRKLERVAGKAKIGDYIRELLGFAR